VAWIYYLSGERRAALAAAERCVAAAEAHGLRRWDIGMAALLHVVRDERPDAAILDELRKGQAEEVMATWRSVIGSCTIALLYGALKAPRQGLEVLAALGDAAKTGLYGPEVYRVQGELRRMASDSPDEAAVCFERAIELARSRELRSLELRAAISLARLWRDQGRREDARRILAGVYGWFTEGFDLPDLRAARTLLEDLGG
ncbi:MAG TPA: hypothetical protein VFT36_07965, partial [Methylomirabilota bacterium]|nr:hypothetical protein [Methylomirabilota bacterium]